MNTGNKKLFLFDAMSMIFRAYYALNKSPRINSKGLNTSAILGFVNSLYEVIHNEQPTHMAVAFDSHGPTVRHADFDQYKANRDNTPEDIIASIPYIQAVLQAFGIPVLALPGYEADDIIGTFAKKAEQAGFTTYMYTTDKDYGQLVSDNIYVYKPLMHGNGTTTLGPAEVCEKYGIQQPEQLIDILGIWGDAIDNIPGIKGIGEVGAKKLIAEFGSIENMVENAHRIKNEKMRIKVQENAEEALLSKKLATIILDVPLAFDENAMIYHGPDMAALTKIFNELEFKTLLQRISKDYASSANSNASMGNSSQPDLFSVMEHTPIENDGMAHYHANSCHYHTFSGVVEWTQWFQQLPATTSIAIAYTLSADDKQLISLAFATQQGEAFYLPWPGQQDMLSIYTPLLQQMMALPNTKIIHNSKSLLHILHAMGISVHTPFIDTMLVHYLLEPELSHTLNILSEQYLQYSLLPSTTPHNYEACCEKADITLQLPALLMPLLEQYKASDLYYDIEMPLVEVLSHMEACGVNIDVPFLQQYSQTLQNKIDIIQNEIYALAGENFNIASPKQLGTILFDKLRIIDNAKLTKSKQYQTGEDVLQKLKFKHPIIEKILDYRGLTKLKSTYIDAFPLLVNPSTGRLHTHFNQTVTATGRLSSSNPNLQNIPIRNDQGKEIRKAFIPADTDHVLLAADYSQIELRLAAALSHDANMMDAFCHNIDIHAATAARIYNVPLEEVNKDMRRTAKTVNFGILYGMSAFGLAERLNISRHDAADLITQYFDQYTGFKNYINTQIAFAQEHGYVETIMHRRRYLRNINSSNSNLRNFDQRNAVNAPIQGSAADLIKIAMINIHRELQQRNLLSVITLQVHDELVLDVPAQEINIVQELVRHHMTTAIALPVPLDIDMNIGNNWLEAH